MRSLSLITSFLITTTTLAAATIAADGRGGAEQAARGRIPADTAADRSRATIRQLPRESLRKENVVVLESVEEPEEYVDTSAADHQKSVLSDPAVSQRARDNQIIQQQTGGNSINIIQQGTNNRAITRQEGEVNELRIDQSGDINEVKRLQKGGVNRSKIIQNEEVIEDNIEINLEGL